MAGFRHQSGRILYALITAVILYGLLNVPAVTVLWLALAWWCVCLWLVRSYPGRYRPLGAVCRSGR